MAIIVQAFHIDATPIAGLYITLNDLRNSHVSHTAFTDDQGNVSEWLGTEMSHRIPVHADVDSPWRLTFHVGLVYPGGNRPFNYVYTDFFVKTSHHFVTLYLAPEEYTVKHGQQLVPHYIESVAAPSWDSLAHPRPVHPPHTILESQDYSPRETTPDAMEATYNDAGVMPQRLSSPDFLALLEDSLDEKNPAEKKTANRKRKRGVMEWSAEPPKLRRSGRLLSRVEPTSAKHGP
ncbi:hypothetical protein B0J18DRAFT_439625 [Chaetomium sp. MPI-SDFR-AT-0129]|nr:hypothetical protein B0J18DRAFT_439625 [Chaetomium sp. MPI-SDFR-AT-0129]